MTSLQYALLAERKRARGVLRSNGLTPRMLKALVVLSDGEKQLGLDSYRINQLVKIALPRTPTGIRDIRDWAIRKLSILGELPDGIEPRWKKDHRKFANVCV